MQCFFSLIFFIFFTCLPKSSIMFGCCFWLIISSDWWSYWRRPVSLEIFIKWPKDYFSKCEALFRVRTYSPWHCSFPSVVMKQKINVYVFLLKYHTSDKKKKHDVTGGIPLKRLLQWVKFGPGNQIHLISTQFFQLLGKQLYVKCQHWNSNTALPSSKYLRISHTMI